MQKRKKRFNSFSKLQKGILFFLVLVAVSLIGVILANTVGVTNPFKFLFKYNTKNHSTKLSQSFSVDRFIDGEDLTITKLPKRPTSLIARNGATRTPNPDLNEACESQILHKLFLRSDFNFKNFSDKIKKEANVDVEVKFYLIPVELQGENEDPQKFFDDKDKFDKLLDVGGFEYEDEDNKGKFKNFFGSYVVFDNQFFDVSSNKIKYKHDWLENPIKVKLLPKSEYRTTKYYYPKDNIFTTQELNNLNNKTNLNYDVIDSYEEYKGNYDANHRQEVTPKSKIPSIDDIDNIIKKKSSTQKYYLYGDESINIASPNFSDFKFPKLITKNNKNAPDNYDKIETLILINFWNEMSLNDEFFTEVAKSKKPKDFYTDASHDLTLFTQITYTLVDNEGNCHKLETGTQGTELKDMKLNDSKAGTGGGSGRKITVRAKQPITQDNTNTNTRIG